MPSTVQSLSRQVEALCAGTPEPITGLSAGSMNHRLLSNVLLALHPTPPPDDPLVPGALRRLHAYFDGPHQGRLGADGTVEDSELCGYVPTHCIGVLACLLLGDEGLKDKARKWLIHMRALLALMTVPDGTPVPVGSRTGAYRPDDDGDELRLVYYALLGEQSPVRRRPAWDTDHKHRASRMLRRHWSFLSAALSPYVDDPIRDLRDVVLPHPIIFEAWDDGPECWYAPEGCPGSYNHPRLAVSVVGGKVHEARYPGVLNRKHAGEVKRFAAVESAFGWLEASIEARGWSRALGILATPPSLRVRIYHGVEPLPLEPGAEPPAPEPEEPPVGEPGWKAFGSTERVVRLGRALQRWNYEELTPEEDAKAAADVKFWARSVVSEDWP